MVDKRMRNLIYAAIAVVCVVSILLGVFRIFLGESTNTTTGGEPGSNQTIDNTQAVIRADFSALFNNTVSRLTDESTMSIFKSDPSSPLIISDYDHRMAYSSVDDKNIDKDKCNIDVHFPMINLSGDYIATVYNPAMDKEFYQVFLARYNKGVELSKKLVSGTPVDTNVVDNQTQENTVTNQTTQTVQTVTGMYNYEVNFTGTIYQNKYLSIAIMSLDLVPGKSQRRFIRTFNVDITTGEEITISKMLQLKGLEASKVNTTIQEQIKKINDSEKSYSSYTTGTYTRDKELAIDGFYDINNIQNFMIGQNGELLLIYNYGNEENNYTITFDVIKIEG